MAKKPPSDEAARAICRTPRPTPAKMKQAFAWAEACPSADKVPWLMLLQTQNWANRKDLREPFEQAVLRCAADDATPLWTTVEEDHDTYRVWHAIQLLVKRDDESLSRLVALGRTPLMAIHWSIIEGAAERRGMGLPDDVRALLTVLRARRGIIDFYEYFHARKAAWPAELDPDPRLAKRKKVVLKATVDGAAKKRARVLEQALADLEAFLAETDPAALDDWRQNPPATSEQLANLAEVLFGGGDQPLPPELQRWFAWHLGEVVNQVELEPEALFAPLGIDDVAINWRQLVEGKQDGELLEPYQVSWVPLFGDGAGDFLCLETKGARRGKLVEFFHDDDCRPWPYRQLADWVTAIVAKRRGDAPKPTKAEASVRTRERPPPPDPSRRFAIGELSPLKPGEPFTQRSAFNALAIGTVLAWEVGSGGWHLYVKLAPACWCGAAGDTPVAAHAAIVQLAARFPPVVWRDDPDGIYGVLRPNDVPHRRGACAVEHLA